MKHQKIMNLLENTPDQPSKFKIKHWVDVGFKTSMLRSSICG